ncbi:3-deoxy-7-phosphoheptulonate synthase [Phlyctochytrium planicorne]|nr:3-deoxy-7-phosphoheptulonate synthase [Phlyctochytrium planicorne]
MTAMLHPSDSIGSLDESAPIDDTRITGYDPLLPPQILQMEYPLTADARLTIAKARRQASKILKGSDDRLLVIVGPCSIHDVDAALEYGKKLKEQADKYKDSLLLIMRSYFEKPRTTVGWKGLINDPHIDGSFRINDGLKIARKLLCDLTDLGVPVGCELLGEFDLLDSEKLVTTADPFRVNTDTISPQFIADTVSWGAIGARTTECQLHRELASGVSFPVGFKNGTDGNVDIALDAITAASHPHSFLGVTKQGLAAITRTNGNDSCHVILRGSKTGPNYEKPFVDDVTAQLKKSGLAERIMIDCSHGNSSKKHKNQIIVCEDVAKQIAAGNDSIFGLMVESNLFEGNQKIPDSGAKDLKYGVSITDACVGWEDTEHILSTLAEAQLKRRARWAAEGRF